MAPVWEKVPIRPRHAVRYRLPIVRPSSPLRPGDGVRALGRIKAEGTHKKRFQTRIALTQDVFRRKCSSWGRRAHTEERWSTRDLQVIDLKAAAALSSSYMIGTDHAGSHTTTVARTCMHHAPSRGCCRAYLAVGE